MPDILLKTSQPTEHTSPSPSEVWLRHTVRLKILTHMPRRSRIVYCPTCFLTQLAGRHRLASSSGTVVPSRTMHPMSCFLQRQTLPSNLGSVRNQSLRSHERRSLTFHPQCKERSTGLEPSPVDQPFPADKFTAGVKMRSLLNDALGDVRA